VWEVKAMPPPLYHRVRETVTIVQKLIERRGRSGRVGKISPTPGFETQAVQRAVIPVKLYQHARNKTVIECNYISPCKSQKRLCKQAPYRPVGQNKTRQAKQHWSPVTCIIQLMHSIIQNLEIKIHVV
jgi:hypothetical protein